MGLSGPAVTALTGGAARASISLDKGRFELVPPPAGYHPAIAESAIVCEALASAEMNGSQFGDDARNGVAVGYGLVTISSSVQMSNLLLVQAGMPTPPAPPRYDNRLAWVVVVPHQEVASCPAMRVPSSETLSPSTTVPALSTWNYAIFLADPATGADTLVYTEAAPAPCGGAGRNGPYESIPTETVSVPWKLVSRDPKGYSGQIEAQAPPCWTVPASVNVERGSNAVEVPATTISGQTCGQTRPVSLTLRADTVFDDLPAQLRPAPLGPAINSASRPLSPSPADTGHLVQLTPQQNGTTISVHVGDVLVAQPPLTPLPTQAAKTGDVIRSSNPAVISELPQEATSLPEFRAWQTGRAVLSQSTTWSATVVVTGS